MIERVAYLSLHTSPLLQPGVGDAGGMNVYIHELAQTMSRRGIGVDVFTRAASPDLPLEVELDEHYRVIHIPAGPPQPLPISALPDSVFEFAEGVIAWAETDGAAYDLVHSHYWLSGWAGLLVKRMLGVPLANSFHTLGRVKDLNRRDGEPSSRTVRLVAEQEVIAGSDCVIASTPLEAEDLLEHYGADPARLCISPPGINHDVFSPGSRREARIRLGFDPDRPMVLYVGRVQALKGLDVAVEAFAIVHAKVPDAHLLIIGGASGPGGGTELAQISGEVTALGLDEATRFLPPQPHEDLAEYYRAADVLVFPSRSESFGLVAAESQASGTPVIAARTGGLTHAVGHGVSGFLIDGWDAGDYAARIVDVLTDPALAAELDQGAVGYSQKFSWEATADRLLELYAGITAD